MNLLEKISYLIEENGINKRKLSLQANIPYSTIDGLYKKGYENMRITTFRKLCDYFGVTMDSMANDDKDIEYISPAASHVVDREGFEVAATFSVLDDRGKEAVRDTMARELAYTDRKKESGSSAASATD